MKKVEQGIGITLGLPTLGRPVVMDWAIALKFLNPPINYNSRFYRLEGRPIAQARNEIADAAVKNGSRYVFMLGDDVVVPPHTLKQLIFRMEHDPNLGVVGGIYCSKTDPPSPLVFRGNGRGCYWDWKVGEYFEVTGLGMDCTLIRTDVFREMEGPPWFVTKDDDEYMEGIQNAEQWTEDLWFIKRMLEETDWTCYADAMVMCEHYDPAPKKKYTLPINSIPMQRTEVPPGEKLILDVGCGHQHWEFEGEGHPIRVDIRDECEPDYRCDARQLPFDEAHFDIVFCSHVLEHFDRHEFEDLIIEWLRVLKWNGELRMIIPDLAWAAKRLLEHNGEMDVHALNVFYGSQDYPENFHKNGFTLGHLKAELKKKGMEIFNNFNDEYNLTIHARFTKEKRDELREAWNETTKIEDHVNFGKDEQVEIEDNIPRVAEDEHGNPIKPTITYPDQHPENPDQVKAEFGIATKSDPPKPVVSTRKKRAKRKVNKRKVSK